MQEIKRQELNKKHKQCKQQTDAPWKYILSKYFKSFMELCWPARALEVNWDKKLKFLDKELIKIAKDGNVGNRVVDKLIEVELLSGDHCCIILHLEVQSTKQPAFSERMFTYRYRLRDFYHQPIASLALLLDKDPNWRPNSYSESLWGSELSIKFPIIKLIDYNQHVEELEQSSNPFAIIILAQLAALKAQAVELKLASKLQLTRKLYGSGFGRKQVVELFRFIDWVINLPKEMEEGYMKSVFELEQEEFEKNFICPAEQIWLEQGIEQGIERGIAQGSTTTALKIAHKMLSKQGITIEDIADFTGISIEELKKLKDKQH